MKTSELINAISADSVAAPAPERALGLALAPALVVAGAFFVAAIGLRANLAAALGADPRVGFKIAFAGALAIVSGALALRLFRPDRSWRKALLLLAAPLAALVVAVVVELASVDPAQWSARLYGHNWRFCLIAVPLLGAAPFVATLAALRYGAPERPAAAGAAAGLFAGAIGATLYALHCPDDSPLFVAAWYMLAIAALTIAGALIGSRLLRW